MTDVTRVQGWFGLIASVLTVAGMIAGGTWWLSRQITAVNDSIAATNSRLDKDESAIRVLNTELPKEKELVNQLLAARSVVHHFGYEGIEAQRSMSAPAAAAAAPAPKEPKK